MNVHSVTPCPRFSVFGDDLARHHYCGKPMASIRTFWRVLWGECFAFFMERIKPPVAIACRLTRSHKKRLILSGRALC